MMSRMDMFQALQSGEVLRFEAGDTEADGLIALGGQGLCRLKHLGNRVIEARWAHPYTLGECASILAVSPSAIQTWYDNGEFPSVYRIGRTLWVSRDAFDEWVSARPGVTHLTTPLGVGRRGPAAA